MKTTVNINDALLAKAQKLTNIKTKNEVIAKALATLVCLQGQKKLLDLWGNV